MTHNSKNYCKELLFRIKKCINIFKIFLNDVYHIHGVTKITINHTANKKLRQKVLYHFAIFAIFFFSYSMSKMYKIDV